MLINPIIGSPTIDKIHLKSFDYKMADSTKFNQRPEIDMNGQMTRLKQFYNSEICNITVEPDKQGKDCIKVFFNPNKVEPYQVLKECRQVGIDFPILESQVIRADIERHQQLRQSLYSYHTILNQSASGRNLKTTNNQSFRIGTVGMQIEIYDKSVQAKLIDPNIVRIESRYLKPNYLQKSGITTLESLLNADTSKLMELYIKPKDMYLGNLVKLEGNQAIEQVGNYISLLEQLHQTSSRPGTTWLMRINIEQVGIDQVLEMVKSADIPKQKKYNLKKQVLKLASEIDIPHRESMVKEILSYFRLAS
jgi:hypothetical protein